MNKKILVVDDSRVMRRNMITIITAAGHEVVGEAGDGETAFQAYEKHKPDLITMDITMPKMDGIGRRASRLSRTSRSRKRKNSAVSCLLHLSINGAYRW